MDLIVESIINKTNTKIVYGIYYQELSRTSYGEQNLITHHRREIFSTIEFAKKYINYLIFDDIEYTYKKLIADPSYIALCQKHNLLPMDYLATYKLRKLIPYSTVLELIERLAPPCIKTHYNIVEITLDHDIIKGF
jgi:hypothetical protein